MKPRTASRAAVALALALGLSAATTTAAPGAQEDAKQEAEALFLKGLDAIEAGDCARAVVLLRESQALYAARGTLLNLALCEAELGQVATASRHLQDLLAILEPDDSRRPLALEKTAALEPRVPRLRIEVAAGALAPARITVDGVVVPSEKLGEELRLDPGDRVVEVEWPNGKRERRSVALAEGKRTVVRLAATPPRAVTPPGPRSTRQPITEGDAARRSIAPAVAAGSLALVGVGVGVAFTVKANDTSSDAAKLLDDIVRQSPAGQSACRDNPTGQCARLSSLLEQQDTDTTIAAVSYGIAGLAAASAVGLLIWARPWADRERGAAVAPVVLVGGGGVRAEGTF